MNSSLITIQGSVFPKMVRAKESIIIHTQMGADPEKGMVAIEETKEEGVEGHYFW